MTLFRPHLALVNTDIYIIGGLNSIDFSLSHSIYSISLNYDQVIQFNELSIKKLNITNNVKLKEINLFDCNILDYNDNLLQGICNNRDFFIKYKKSILREKNISIHVDNDLIENIEDVDSLSPNLLYMKFDTISKDLTIKSLKFKGLNHLFGYSTCIKDNTLYLYGGKDLNSNTIKKDFYEIDLEDLKLSKIFTSFLHRPNYYLQSVRCLNDGIILFGGRNKKSKNSLSHYLKLDYKTRKWTKIKLKGDSIPNYDSYSTFNGLEHSIIYNGDYTNKQTDENKVYFINFINNTIKSQNIQTNNTYGSSLLQLGDYLVMTGASQSTFIKRSDEESTKITLFEKGKNGWIPTQSFDPEKAGLLESILDESIKNSDFNASNDKVNLQRSALIGGLSAFFVSIFILLFVLFYPLIKNYIKVRSKNRENNTYYVPESEVSRDESTGLLSSNNPVLRNMLMESSISCLVYDPPMIPTSPPKININTCTELPFPEELGNISPISVKGELADSFYEIDLDSGRSHEPDDFINEELKTQDYFQDIEPILSPDKSITSKGSPKAEEDESNNPMLGEVVFQLCPVLEERLSKQDPNCEIYNENIKL